MNVPIIRLEVEGMKHAMLQALSNYHVQMDQEVKAAVEAYCTPENLSHILHKEVYQQLDFAVKEEVRRFFDYSGNGRAAVREAVENYLNEYYPKVTKEG